MGRNRDFLISVTFSKQNLDLRSSTVSLWCQDEAVYEISGEQSDWNPPKTPLLL